MKKLFKSSVAVLAILASALAVASIIAESAKWQNDESEYWD